MPFGKKRTGPHRHWDERVGSLIGSNPKVLATLRTVSALSRAGSATSWEEPIYVYSSHKADGLPFIEGKVGKTWTKLLVDSGAGMTLVHKRLVPTKDYKIQATTRRIAGVTGTDLGLLGEVDVEFEIKGRRITHHCLVSEEMDMDALLGFDFLKAGGYVLDFSPGEPTSRGPKPEAYLKLNHDSGLRSTELRLGKETYLPANTRTYIQVAPEESLNNCLEARVEPVALTEDGVWTEDSVTNIGTDGRILVGLVNSSPQGVTLERRTLLARVTSVPGKHLNVLTIQDWLETVETPATYCHQIVVDGTVDPNRPARSGHLGAEEAQKKNRSNRILQKIDRTTMTVDQQYIIRSLVQQRPGCFALDGEPLSTTPLTQFRLHTGNTPPIRRRAYRLPECHKTVLKQIINRQLEAGIIAPSRSEWSAPILLVPKKDTGKFRLVVDHRMLNKSLRKDSYPLPRINDLLDELGGAKIYTTLDMKDSYHQVAIHPADRHKTAFICREGLFEYIRMSMGISTAPSCFQRMLEQLFADMKQKGVLIYLDDIIVYTKDLSTHHQVLKEVFERLELARLTLRPEKCQFFKERVTYLGHLVTAEGVYPHYENVRKVREYPVPNTVKQLRSFLGLAAYYRRFVRNFSAIAKPLTELTKKETRWSWEEAQQQAFETLRRRLTEAPILAYPRFDTPFVLQTDASDYCLGAVLSQTQDGAERVISYGSRSLKPAELNYSTTEKEALSIVHFVGEYRPYLLGRKFYVETDHNPLTFLNKQQEPKGRLGRWAIALSEFEYEVRYKPGRVNNNADALSRLPDSHVGTVAAILEPDGDQPDLVECISTAKIRAAQQRDEWCRAMINYLRRNELPSRGETLIRRVALEANRYMIRGDGVLTYVPHARAYSAPEMGIAPVIVLPEPLRPVVLELLHDHLSAGHLGFQKTLRKVSERFHWQGMYADVERYTKRCHSCAKVKTPPILRKAPHAAFTTVTKPLEEIQIDFVGPISPRAHDGSSVILVVTDCFTKYAEAYPLANQKAPLVAQTLVEQYFCRYGAPLKLHSDQGKSFRSALVKEIMRLYQVKHVQGSAYRPQSQGSVERLNRVLVEMLKNYTTQDVFRWNEYIPYVVSAYNASVHASTLYTPYELFYGRAMRLPIDALIHRPEPSYRDVGGYHEEVAERLYIAHQNARQNSAAARKAQADYYNQRTRKRDFRVGDRVYITNEARKAKKRPGTDEHGNEDSRKFRMAWLGVYRIIARKGEVVYQVKHEETGKTEIVHEDRMKLTYDSRMEHRRGAAEAVGPGPTRYQLRSGGKKRRRREEQENWDDKSSSSSDSSESSDDGDLFPQLPNHGGANEPPEGDEVVQPDHNEEEVQLEVLPEFHEEEVEDFEIAEEADVADPPDPELNVPAAGPNRAGLEETQPELEIPATDIVGTDGEHLTPDETELVTVPGSSTPPDTEWWNKLKTPRPSTTPKAATPTGKTEAGKPGNSNWWGRRKTPEKSTPAATTGGADGAGGEISAKRREELTDTFRTKWGRKQKRERKYEATFPLNLKKYAKTETELRYLQNLQAEAAARYEPPTPKTHATRQTRKKAASNQALYVTQQEAGTRRFAPNPEPEPQRILFRRGKLIEGRYALKG